MQNVPLLEVSLSSLTNLLCFALALVIYNHGNNSKSCTHIYFGLLKPKQSLFLALGFGEAGWVWRPGVGGPTLGPVPVLV